MGLGEDRNPTRITARSLLFLRRLFLKALHLRLDRLQLTGLSRKLALCLLQGGSEVLDLSLQCFVVVFSNRFAVWACRSHFRVSRLMGNLPGFSRM